MTLFDDTDGQRAAVTGAILSDDGTYRYALWRQWGLGKPLVFVMLNPSTADADQDDPTIRRCVGFAKREGAAGIHVVNLFAYRATKPAELLHCPVDVVGPDNHQHLRAAGQLSGSVIAAWGAHPVATPFQVSWARRALRVPLQCLGTTAAGHPRHPLYVRGDAPLIDYATRA